MCWRGWARCTGMMPKRAMAPWQPQSGCDFHQEHSGPVMEKLHGWLEAQFAERKTEPNSGLGKAITYLLRHWKALTTFLREAGAPLDNNLGERSQAGGVAPQECVLQDATRGRGGRPVHDADPHLPVMWCQLVRLPDRTAAACAGTGGQPGGVDAVELPRDAGAELKYHNPCMAEKDRLWPGRDATRKWPENGPFQRQNRITFWPGTEPVENVSDRL
jgi:hypothetical protein